MKEKMSIAVIIPVYNMKNRLRQCVESLIRQTIDNYKIYLIDDGSTDGSGQICDELQSEFDSKVVVLHKVNGGVSDARNFGIVNSESDLITFVDPDDYVSKFYLENLYVALTSAEADITCCRFVEQPEYENLKIEEDTLDLKEIDKYSSDEALKILLYQRGIDFAVWGKLFRRELFENIKFPIGKRYEDVPVTLRLFAKSNCVVIYDSQDYIYWQRTEGMMNSSFNDTKLDIVEMMEDMLVFIKVERPQLIRAAKCRYFAGLSNVYFQIPKDHEAKKKIWRILKSIRKEVSCNKEASHKVRLGALLSYLGSQPMEVIYACLKKDS